MAMPMLAERRHLMAVDMIGLAERGADAARKPHGVLRRLEVLGDDGELVAAEPPDEIDLAHAFLQPRRDLREQRIAGGMAERVVDVLEAVEIEAEHRHQLAVPLGRARRRGRDAGEAAGGWAGR